MIMETKIYNLSSNSANVLNNGSLKSNLTFNIPNFIQSSDNIINIYFSVYSAEVPNSFYLINQYNNTLYLSDGSTTTTYTITYGNYTISNLITTLQSLLTGYTITYNSITLKITITHSTIPFQVLANSTISRILGLDDETDSVLSLSYTCPYVVNLLPQQKIHFRSNGLQLDTYNTYDKSTDIFLSLQNTAQLGGAIYYKNNSGNKYLLDINFLQKLDIRITDDKNRELDFNNCNWYLTLKIDYELKERNVKLSLSNILGKDKQLLQYFLNTLEK